MSILKAMRNVKQVDRSGRGIIYKGQMYLQQHGEAVDTTVYLVVFSEESKYTKEGQQYKEYVFRSFALARKAIGKDERNGLPSKRKP